MFFFFFNDTATTEIYTYCHTLSLHDALPIAGPAGISLAQSPAGIRGSRADAPGRRRSRHRQQRPLLVGAGRQRNIGDCMRSRQRLGTTANDCEEARLRSEEHTSELQSLMRISYAVFCLTKKTKHLIKK